MQRIGVVFGGVSVEHEVSIITGLQAAAALDEDRYHPVPVYISKSGVWYTGGSKMLEMETYKDFQQVADVATPVQMERLPGGGMALVAQNPSWKSWLSGQADRWDVDVMLVALHGGWGENGGIQGFFETMDVPYTGSGPEASSLGMNKVLAKQLCRAEGIPVVDFVSIAEGDWAYQEEEQMDRIEGQLDYPLMVKPVHLGSSIGISRVRERSELDHAIEEALRYDEEVLIERAVKDVREINCSMLGNRAEARTSVLEEPVRSDDRDLLSFEDKYERGNGGSKSGGQQGAKSSSSEGLASQERIIPAPIGDDLVEHVRETSREIFRLFGCEGVARIDFLYEEETETIYFNELNTIPGSLSFYLWEPSDVSFDELTHSLVQLAVERANRKGKRIRSYDTNILSLQTGGMKQSAQ